MHLCSLERVIDIKTKCIVHPAGICVVICLESRGKRNKCIISRGCLKEFSSELCTQQRELEVHLKTWKLLYHHY